MSNTDSPTALEGTPVHVCDRKWESPADGEFQSAHYNEKCFFTEHLDDGVKNASLETVKLYGDGYFCAMHAKKPSASEWEDRKTQQGKILQALNKYYEEPNKAVEKNDWPGDGFGSSDSDKNIIIFNECHVVTRAFVYAYTAKILIDRSVFSEVLGIVFGQDIEINESKFEGTVTFKSAVSSLRQGTTLLCYKTTFDDVIFDNIGNLEFDETCFKDICIFRKDHEYIFSNDAYSFTSCYLENNTFEKRFPKFLGVELPLHHDLPTTIDAYPFMKQRVKCWRNIGKFIKALGLFMINLAKALKPSKGWKDRLKSTRSNFTQSIIEEDINNKNPAHDLFLMTRQLKESNTAGFYMYLEECCKGWKGNKLAKAYNVFFGSGYSLGRPLVCYVISNALAWLIIYFNAKAFTVLDILLHSILPISVFRAHLSLGGWATGGLFAVSLFQLLSMFIFGLAVSWRSRKRG